MKVEISFTENVSDNFLCALGDHYRKGRAFTKQEFIEYRIKNGTANDKTIIDNYNAAKKLW